jgi:hypothetical protein
MAGAGYKLFNTGDVLTAAQVNTYLQEQTVMRFASAAARTTALSGVLAEGMVSYLMDTNAVEVYDGSAWVGVATGDITAVTAGTGISGGGTSGAVTITNSMATEITAAGDIIVGTGSGTFDNLPIGTTGQVLTADTTVSPYKVKWASAASGGGMTSIASGNLSSNTVTLSSISSSYIDLALYVRDYYFAADDYLCIRVNSDTGTNYGWISIGQSAEDTAAVGCDGIRDRLFAAGDDGKESADKDVFTSIYIRDYANTSHKKTIDIRTVVRSQNDVYNTQFTWFGNWNSASAISSITLFTQNTNNFSGGSYELYGVK